MVLNIIFWDVFNHIGIGLDRVLSSKSYALCDYLYEVCLELVFVTSLWEIIVIEIKLDGEENFGFKIELDHYWQTN